MLAVVQRWRVTCAGASRLEELLQGEGHRVRLRIGVLCIGSKCVSVVALLGLRTDQHKLHVDDDLLPAQLCSAGIHDNNSVASQVTVDDGICHSI